MPSLSEVCTHVRSKNAGPFWITIDLTFADRESLARHAGDALALGTLPPRLGHMRNRQQLGAQIVVQIGRNTLSLVLGGLCGAQRRQLLVTAFDFARLFGHPRFQLLVQRFGMVERLPVCIEIQTVR